MYFFDFGLQKNCLLHAWQPDDKSGIKKLTDLGSARDVVI